MVDVLDAHAQREERDTLRTWIGEYCILICVKIVEVLAGRDLRSPSACTQCRLRAVRGRLMTCVGIKRFLSFSKRFAFCRSIVALFSMQFGQSCPVRPPPQAFFAWKMLLFLRVEAPLLVAL